MGNSHKLIEIDLELIQEYLHENMPQALSEVSADRVNTIGQLPSPREYFTYDTANAFQAPCIFIVPDSQDFRLGEQKANFIDAVSKIYVTAVIEANKAPFLQYCAYRYQAALHKLLAQTQLQTSDSTVKIVIKVLRSRFSATYTKAQEKGNAPGVFRKEVLLECDVEHYEALT